MHEFLVLCSWFLVAISSLASARAAEQIAIPVDGQPFAAALTHADAGGKLHFTAGDEKREIASADLVLWGAFPEATRGPQVLLVGGGRIVADITALDREELTAVADLAGELKLPLSAVAGIVFHPPHDRYLRDQWIEKTLSAGGDTDRILLDNGDELTGTISGLNEETLVLETAAGKADIDLARAAAVVFNPALADKPLSAGQRALVGLRDGSRLMTTSLVVDGDQAALKLAGGIELKTKAAADLVAIQPFGGRTVYLSDRPAASYRHLPFLSLAWPYHANRNVLGSQLRAGGKLFVKGIGCHSACRLTYDLDRDYARLQAELAIDDQAGGRGSTVFRVFVDAGDGAWQAKYTSPIVRGGEPPVSMSVDLAGVKRVSLLVEFADHGDELDYADWINLRVVK